MQRIVTSLLIVLLLAHWFPVTTCLANKRILPPSDMSLRDKNGGNMAPGNEYGGVSTVVTYIYETYMAGCHLLLITGGEGSHISHLVLRGLRDAYIPEAILNLQLTSYDQSDALLLQLRVGEEKVTCRVFLFDLTGSGSPSLALEFMDKVQLFLVRHTHVLFVGSPDHLQASLQSKALWNSVRVLYLAVMPTGESPPQGSVAAQVKSVIKYGRHVDSAVGLLVPLTGYSESVVVYCRCLFCDGGEAGIRLLNKWTPKIGFVWNNSLFEDEFADMNGHQLKIVQLDWYPFLDYDRDTNETSTTVTPKDSVDMRMLNAIAKVRNFTYVMRVPWDEQWGVITPNGNWTGMIGTLQHHKADFSMSVTYLRERLSVIDYTRVYVIEPLVLVSSKPRQIPSYLALIQPFEGELWVGVLISCASAGIVLWALQFVWSKASGKPGLPLDISFLSTWSTIFEKPTATLPENASGLMFLVWWWVYCTLITVVYKSSLVAHLSVPGKSPTIDSFEELLQKQGWTWGFENTHLACYAWLKYNEVPAIQKVFKSLEIQEIPGQMTRVLKGRHVLIVKKFRIKSIVAASYTNKFGYTPVYYSKAEYFRSGHGWGFRRNAPYKRAIDLMKQRLIEAGLVYHWINQMIGSPRKKEECKDANCLKEKEEKKSGNAAQLSELQGSSENVVLGLHHLQTVFYLFALGLTAALLAFLFENWVFFCTQKTRSVTASEEI